MKNSTGIGNKRFQEEQLQNHRRIIYLFMERNISERNTK